MQLAENSSNRMKGEGESVSNISRATCICHATSARVLAKVHRRHLAHYTHHRSGRLIFTHPSMSPTTRVCSRSIPPFHPQHVLVPLHACQSYTGNLQSPLHRQTASIPLHWYGDIPTCTATNHLSWIAYFLSSGGITCDCPTRHM